MHAATSKVENSAQGLSCELKFVRGFVDMLKSRVTRRLIEMSPNIWKKWPKNVKISTLKLNFKVQIIYVKPNLKP
jgi:hypothetical protein